MKTYIKTDDGRYISDPAKTTIVIDWGEVVAVVWYMLWGAVIGHFMW